MENTINESPIIGKNKAPHTKVYDFQVKEETWGTISVIATSEEQAYEIAEEIRAGGDYHETGCESDCILITIVKPSNPEWAEAMLSADNNGGV
jgi:hypothetical protein